MFKKILFSVFFLVLIRIDVNASEKVYSDFERVQILGAVKSNDISAVTIKETEMFADRNIESKILYVLPKSCFVQIQGDHSAEWYFISEVLTGLKGWVKRECLEMPPEAEVITNDISRAVIEGYVNIMGIESITNYLVFTDISRQKVYVFHGNKENWTLIKTLPCSTGKIETPTIKGVFKISERGEWFYSERLGSGAKNWMRFSGSYLFHSQAMDKNRNVLEENNEIGKRVSNGCVRLYLDDVEWLYRNVPDKTTVVIY